ncbi:MAG TPA: condensation domain-containing protein, partial [Longimicrobiaceae bacterium]|nr:condensation domain-containing protein [Longimicrobiaceae bacterium]
MEVRLLVAEEAARPFDLAAGPLLRVCAVRLDEAEWGVLFTLHHIVSDGWSTGVLIREVSAFYDAFSEGRDPALPELAVQYADYAAWQRAWLAGEILEAKLGYWRDRLADAPPLLELPTDRPRPQVQDPRGGVVGVRLSADVERGLRALSRREGATVFMTLLAAWQLLLARYAGVEDVSVGTPIAGRTRLETEPLIGFFVNTLVLRTDFSGEPTFRELLGRVRETTLGAYQHQEIPFERLVEELAPERSLAHSPLFQVMFVLQNNERRGLRIGELEMEPLADGGDEEIARFDLTLGLAEDERGFAGSLSYRPELWERATMRRMREHLEVLLEGMSADPGRRLSEVSLLRGAERKQVLEAWNTTAAAFPRESCIHELFAGQAARTPGAVAMVACGRARTYSELERGSNRLAQRLVELGVGPESRVGICLERGPEMVVALLGVLKAGGAYLPLDPSYPSERLAYMLADSGATVLLTQAVLAAALPAFAGVRLCLDATDAAPADEPPVAPAVPVEAQNVAYVIYTSGSTGQPKGVAVPHRAVVNFLGSMRARPGLSAGDTLLAVTTLSFDIAVLELFLPLTTGARVVVADRETASDGARLREALAASGATTMQATPATWWMLLEA